jgi:hypothetical protein
MATYILIENLELFLGRAIRKQFTPHRFIFIITYRPQVSVLGIKINIPNTETVLGILCQDHDGIFY